MGSGSPRRERRGPGGERIGDGTFTGPEAGDCSPGRRRRGPVTPPGDAVLTIEGALVLSGGLVEPAPFRRALRRIPDALLAPGR